MMTKCKQLWLEFQAFNTWKYKSLLDRYPRISPDGKYIAYMRSVSVQLASIYIVPPETKKPIQQEYQDWITAFQKFLADGKWLAYVEERGSADIWLVENG